MKAEDLKVGDKFLLDNTLYGGSDDKRFAIVTSLPIATNQWWHYDIFSEDGNSLKSNYCYGCMLKNDIKLISTQGKNNLVGKIMQNLKEMYLGLTVGEPQKSRQKAGIVDKDNLPTDDGLKMMVMFLMENCANVADFDTKVVKPIVDQMEKEIN